ncbi:MAG: hypothetical protein ACI9JM_001821 [Halioglobus sp.]|jgi:hypothetical protein
MTSGRSVATLIGDTGANGRFTPSWITSELGRR